MVETIEELKSFFARLVAINTEKLLDESYYLASLINYEAMSTTNENILFKPMESGIDLNEVIASVVTLFTKSNGCSKR